MNRNNPQTRARRALDTVRNLGNRAAAAGSLLMLSAGSAMAATSTKDQIMAKVTEFQTDGAAIAGAVTLAIFVVAAAKWLRRAK